MSDSCRRPNPQGRQMGQGKWVQSLGQRLLLIAVAIQGITPDADDLASTKALVLLCPVLASDEVSGGGDEWPDDACDLPPLHLGWPRRQQAEEPLLAGLLTTQFPGQIRPGDDHRL